MEIEGSARLNPTHTLATLSFGYLTFAAKPQPNRRMIGKTMTAPRHQRKLCLPLSCGVIRAAVLAAILGSSIPAIRAATTERIVTERYSGLAISGFDPVAYFIDGTATPGKDAYEHAFAGVVWRFCNEGNRAAFILDPDVYMPRFGGYDPVGVARGVAVPGDPRLWLISRERLYLFYSREARSTFAGDLEYLITNADRMWPSVALTLSP